VIAGVSARAFAESAARAGFACRAVDAFGDLDLKALVPAIGLRRDLGLRYSATAAARVGREIGASAVAYVGNFENHPAAVRRLAAGARLLGNTPAALGRARDPRGLAAAVAAAGEGVPTTLPPAQLGRADPSIEWLCKPARGGGGSGVRPWLPGMAVGPGELVKERARGTLASAVFLADGARAHVLGTSHQLAGEAELGGRGFRYCGSIYPLEPPPAHAPWLEERVRCLAEAVTAAFGLRGVNGIDFILRGDELLVLELNPRFPASAELMERATGVSIFAAHAAACAGELPGRAPSQVAGAWGKAIVYAREDVVTRDTKPWLDRPDVRDVPFPGERIPVGSPVCTVFARGANAAECRARLIAAARAIEQELHVEAGRSH